MALWGSVDNSANAPKWTVLSGVGSNANGFLVYQNTRTSAFVSGLNIGIEGVNTIEMGNLANGAANSANIGRVAHSGWNLRIQGTGFVQSVAITNGGQGYNANGFITFTGGGVANTPANASFFIANSLNTQQSFSANALQNTIVSVVVNTPGANYTSAPVANALTSNITAATFTVTMGGRVGRVQYETLVAMGNVS